MPTLRPDTNWTAEQIDALPVEQHFRMRGIGTTRLDTLIDAAFAFTLTMLVISHGGVPTSFAELTDGILQIPALMISFAILMMFWFGHRKWSRRYGIENIYTVTISVSLVFVLLIYIYPLRLIFEGMFSMLSGGRLQWNLVFTSNNQVRGFFAFYSTGSLAMASLMSALYFSSLKHKSQLLLDEYECLATKNELHRWLAMAVFSIISIILAISLPVQLISLSGFVLFGIFIYNAIHTRFYRRRVSKLTATNHN